MGLVLRRRRGAFAFGYERKGGKVGKVRIGNNIGSVLPQARPLASPSLAIMQTSGEYRYSMFVLRHELDV